MSEITYKGQLGCFNNCKSSEAYFWYIYTFDVKLRVNFQFLCNKTIFNTRILYLQANAVGISTLTKISKVGKPWFTEIKNIELCENGGKAIERSGLSK